MITSYLRTVVLYIILIAVVRFMGKRQIGQMEPSEFVVAMLIADLIAIPMQNSGIPLYYGVVPVVTVLGLELLLSGLSMKSLRIRRLLCGKPVVLIDNGKLCQDNLRKTRLSLDELTSALREKNILDMTAVQYAILETNGVVTVFPYPKFRPANAKDAGVTVKEQFLPVTVVEDGHLFREDLKRAGKDENWVEQVLKEHQANLSDTLLLTVDKTGKVLFLRKEARR